MLVDSRSIAAGSSIQADLCIIGAGPAGISIACEFANHSFRVVLLEGGGTKVLEENQLLLRGQTTGHTYPPLHVCRRRVLGGSSSHWGGWAHPLDSIDFEERDWVANSGWPLTRNDLEPWYVRANQVCRLGAIDYRPEEDSPWCIPVAHRRASKNFQTIRFGIAPTRFGKRYRKPLEVATNVRVLLNGNVVEIESEPTGELVTSVRVATLAKSHFRVLARLFVLASGGIENARLLLVSRRWQDHGIGNMHDLVGRFFADHLHLRLSNRPLNGYKVPALYRTTPISGVTCRGGLALTEEVRRREKLLGCAFTLHNPDDPHDVVFPNYTNSGYSSLQAILRSLADGELPDLFGSHLRLIGHDSLNTFALALRKVVKAQWRAYVLGCRAEQAPNPNSRVTLDTERDELGMNKVRLDWRLGAQDYESLNIAQLKLMEEFTDPNSTVPLRSEPSLDVTGASHHMGTTRMHDNPKHGIVDADCRVHGVRNLFVAGTSVFPTSGWSPPTLTVVALALRLADHIKQRDTTELPARLQLA